MGCGLSYQHTNVGDTSKWPNPNLFGDLLTMLRHDLVVDKYKDEYCKIANESMGALKRNAESSPTLLSELGRVLKRGKV